MFEEKDKLLEQYAILKTSQSALAQLPADSVVNSRVSAYGAEALVRKDRLPRGTTTEYTSLEDIILFLAKGGERA